MNSKRRFPFKMSLLWPGIQGVEVKRLAGIPFRKSDSIIGRSGYLIGKQGKCFFLVLLFSVPYKDKRHMSFIK